MALVKSNFSPGTSTFSQNFEEPLAALESFVDRYFSTPLERAVYSKRSLLQRATTTYFTLFGPSWGGMVFWIIGICL